MSLIRDSPFSSLDSYLSETGVSVRPGVTYNDYSSMPLRRLPRRAVLSFLSPLLDSFAYSVRYLCGWPQ